MMSLHAHMAAPPCPHADEDAVGRGEYMLPCSLWPAVAELLLVTSTAGPPMPMARRVGALSVLTTALAHATPTVQWKEAQLVAVLLGTLCAVCAVQQLCAARLALRRRVRWQLHARAPDPPAPVLASNGHAGDTESEGAASSDDDGTSDGVYTTSPGLAPRRTCSDDLAAIDFGALVVDATTVLHEDTLRLASQMEEIRLHAAAPARASAPDEADDVRLSLPWRWWHRIRGR